MSDDDRSVLRIRPGATAWSAAGDEAVVLDLERSAYVSLNDTASLLWQRLTGGATREDLAAALLAEYDVSEDVARTEVDAFVTDLARRGYLSGI